MKEYRCGSYERLSKEDLKKFRTDESMSIEGQRLIINSYCQYNKLKIVEDYVDDGYSGGNYDRPSFKKMIQDIELGKINCVITKDLSRLGRELYKTGEFIEDYFIDKKVRYIAINDNYDSLKGDDGSISMKLTFNDYTLRDTSRKVKSSLDAKRKAGQYIGSFAKYGYQKDPNDKHHLIIDSVASIVVKRIFDMALNGNSPYYIADTLTKEKVPIPIVYKKETRGLLVTENDGYGIWKPQTIRDILTSEMYLGNMVQNTYEKIRYNSKKLRKVEHEDYIIVENTHEPIIDEDTFKKVNELLISKKKIPSKKTNKYLFSGLLFCKECGHRISILEKKNKGNNSHYTQCCLYSKKGKYGICNIHRVNYNLLEEDLVNVITNVCKSFVNEYDNNLLTKEANLILDDELLKLQKDANNITKEINKYNNAIESLYLDKVENKIDISIFDNLLAKYKDELSRAKENLERLDNQKKDLVSAIDKIDYEKCEKIVKSFLQEKKLNYKLISRLVKKVEIDNDKKVKIYFNFPELSCYVN